MHDLAHNVVRLRSIHCLHWQLSIDPIIHNTLLSSSQQNILPWPTLVRLALQSDCYHHRHWHRLCAQSVSAQQSRRHPGVETSTKQCQTHMFHTTSMCRYCNRGLLQPRDWSHVVWFVWFPTHDDDYVSHHQTTTKSDKCRLSVLLIVFVYAQCCSRCSFFELFVGSHQYQLHSISIMKRKRFSTIQLKSNNGLTMKNKWFIYCFTWATLLTIFGGLSVSSSLALLLTSNSDPSDALNYRIMWDNSKTTTTTTHFSGIDLCSATIVELDRNRLASTLAQQLHKPTATHTRRKHTFAVCATRLFGARRCDRFAALCGVCCVAFEALTGVVWLADAYICECRAYEIYIYIYI